MYDNIIDNINSRLPDNTTGQITPLHMRQNFADTIAGIGENSHFMGYAPLNNPVPTPDGKRWYITNPKHVATYARTYTGYGSSMTVKIGQQYIVWYDGTHWNWTIVERDFQNANYGTDGQPRLVIPPIHPDAPIPTPESPRVVQVVADAADTEHVLRIQVDGVDVDVADYIELTDGDSHTVTMELDNTYGNSTPSLYDGIAAERITLPYGVTNFDAPVGTTDTEVVLPPTVTHIDAAAISANSAQAVTLTGAPPTLDDLIDWGNIQSLTLPDGYSLLYGSDTGWQAAVSAVVDAGGSVEYESGDAYKPVSNGNTLNVLLTSLTADPTAEWVVESDKTAKEIYEAVHEDAAAVNGALLAPLMMPLRASALELVEVYHKHTPQGYVEVEITEKKDGWGIEHTLVQSGSAEVTLTLVGTAGELKGAEYTLNGSLNPTSINNGTATIDLSGLAVGEYSLLVRNPGIGSGDIEYRLIIGEPAAATTDQYKVLFRAKAQYSGEAYDADAIADNHYFDMRETYVEGELTDSGITHYTQGRVVPTPSVADAGKMLQVSAQGAYELVTIVNSENVPY